MKIEVHLQGGLRKIIDITPGATVGATIGRNVFNADGTLYVPPSSGGSSQLSITSWELILNIPPNVTALANTATTGLYAITASGASATRAVAHVAGETTVSNGDGVSGDPTVGLADVSPIAGGTLQKYGFDSKGRRSEEEAATTDDLTEGSSNLYFTDERAQAAVVVPIITDGDTTHSPSGDAVFDALAWKEPTITAGTTGQFWRGDKAWSDTLTATLNVVNNESAPGILGGLFGLYVAAPNSSNAFSMFDAFGGATGLVFRRSNGTASTPTAVTTNQSLGQFQCRGHNGTAYTGEAVSVNMLATQNWAVGSNGSGVEVRTTRSGSASTVSTLFIDINGVGSVTPGADNTQTLGSSSLRWSVVYAGTGAINTSDAREKTIRGPLTGAELAWARDLASLAVMYQWNDAIAEKGEDARLHCSPTVQAVIASAEKHGLDPFRYGFVCYDQWDELPEIRGEDGKIVQEHRHAGNRYSLRPSELQFFIALGQEERLRRLEALLNP